MEFKDLVTGESSDWLKRAKWRKKNEYWIRNSFYISIKILRQLKNLNHDYDWLANQLGFPIERTMKILKGTENLSLKTISKLEKILEISILEK